MTQPVMGGTMGPRDLSGPPAETDVQFLARGLLAAITGTARFTVDDHKRLVDLAAGR